MTQAFEVIDPDVITIGTVGVPGQRTFFLQARSATDCYSLKMEKQQVSAIGELLAELLADLPSPDALTSSMELLEPVEELWAVGSLQLAYEEMADRVVISADPIEPMDLDQDDEDEVAPDTARLLISRAQAAALIKRCRELIEGGRPPCPLCGYPLDPAGHSCPKTNGHGPPKL